MEKNTNIEEAEARTKKYLESIKVSSCLASTSRLKSSLPAFTVREGKVRDIYSNDNHMILISTDRLSAFDRHIATIPNKGKVLNLTSAWWFENTRHIIPNHMVAVPDPNSMQCKKCEVFPVEFVVRGYITGSTSTSMWTHYEQGSRMYCGISLPDGYQKHQKLVKNLVTPTTKDDDHDELISGEDIVREGRMTMEEWKYCEKKALELFSYGQEIARSRGLILVDTKYEFGKDTEGNIMLIDEIHTPDSSRYWISSTYSMCLKQGLAPDSIDKEFLRIWFRERCNPYEDKTIPEAPTELIVELSRRYVMLYEIITHQKFQFDSPKTNVEDRLVSNLCLLDSK